EMEDGFEAEAGLLQRGKQDGDLQDAGDQDEEAKPIREGGLDSCDFAGVFADVQVEDSRADGEDGDVAEVEDDRRGGGGAESFVHLEDAGEKCAAADEKNVRQH